MSSTSKARSTPKLNLIEASQALSYLGVRTSGEFFKLCRDKLRPFCIPARPDLFYREQFKSWDEFLELGAGTPLATEVKAQIDSERLSLTKESENEKKGLSNLSSEKKSTTRKIPKVSMQQAAMMLVALGVDSSTALAQLVKERRRPAEVPSRPDLFYRADFVSWDHFFQLGHEGLKKSLKFESIVDFKTLCGLVFKLGINNKSDFRKAIKDGRLPPLTPSMPDSYYTDEWTSWKEFLAPKAFYVCFEEARQIARSYRFENRYQWVVFCRSGNLPEFIPKSPDREYEEFTTWDDFLKDNESL